MTDRDIIVAAATPLQPAARAIVRMSGSGCHELIADVVNIKKTRGRLSWGSLKIPLAGIPVQLYLFAEGRSYSAEEMVECHLPGNPRLVSRLLAELMSRGAREAEPGEFTRRAVEHGRLDLHQAAAVLEIIGATSEANRRRALKILSDRRQDRLAHLMERLHMALVSIENDLDFDEGDAGLLDAPWYDNLLSEIESDWAALNEGVDSEFVPHIVLTGSVNVGKSTLFNALGGQALESEEAGTTRDWLEHDLLLDGRLCRLVDVPGSGGPDCDIDRAAMKLARPVIARADLVVRLARAGSGDDADWFTCADLHEGPGSKRHLSARTGHGLETFKIWLAETLQQQVSAGWLDVDSRRVLSEEIELLASNHRGPHGGDGVVWSAHLREIRRLLDPLGTRVHPDDVLNDLFGRFCIGK